MLVLTEIAFEAGRIPHVKRVSCHFGFWIRKEHLAHLTENALKANLQEREKRGALTCAAAHVLCNDASEVPESRLAAVALESPDAGFTGALAGGGVTGASV